MLSFVMVNVFMLIVVNAKCHVFYCYAGCRLYLVSLCWVSGGHLKAHLLSRAQWQSIKCHSTKWQWTK